MNWIKSNSLLLCFLAVALCIAAWKFKNFAVLMLGITTLSVSIGVVVRRFSVVTIPVTFSLIALTFVEFVLPVFISSDRNGFVYHDPKSDFTNGYHQRVQGFGHLPTPGTHSSRRLTRDGDVIYDVIYSIGSDGYRKERPDQINSVNIYGGSFIFGEGLSDDETLVHYMWKDHGVSAKSVGVHGYGLHQALYNINNGLSSIDGVNVLLTFPAHALRSNCKVSYAAGTPKYELDNGLVKLEGTCFGGGIVSRVLSYSAIADLVSKYVSRLEGGITDDDIELYLGIIRSIALQTHHYKSKLVIAFINAGEEDLRFTTWTNETLRDEMLKIADGFVDVSLMDQHGMIDNKYYLHNYDHHPSALANSERASLIVETLADF